MSFDLMVFDPAAAPRGRAGFLKWIEARQSGDEEDGPPSQEPGSLTPALRAWFEEMVAAFPPLNGPLATDDVDNPKATDYGLNRTYVSACFAWSQADEAFRRTIELAEKHGVGVFDQNSDPGDVWVPGPDGELEAAPD